MNSYRTTTNRRPPQGVWIVASTVGLGGAERVTVHLANALAEHVPVTLYCWHSDTGIHRAGLDPRIVVVRHTGEKMLRRMLNRRRPAMIINNITGGLLPFVPELVQHTPSYVQIIHSACAFSWQFLRPELVGVCAKVLVVAPYLVAQMAGFGVPRDKVVCIETPIDEEAFAPVEMQQAREKVGLPPDLPLVLYAGRASSEKGIRHFPRFLTIARQRGVPVRLVAVGMTEPGHDGERGYNADRRILHRELRQARVWDMWIERPPVACPREYYGASHATLLLSEKEGSPLCVVEALACGRPVIATETGDVARWCLPATGSIVIPPGDSAPDHAVLALTEILERSENEARMMSKNAREYVVSLRGLKQWKRRGVSELLQLL